MSEPLTELIELVGVIADGQSEVNTRTFGALDKVLDLVVTIIADQQLMEARLLTLEAESHA